MAARDTDSIPEEAVLLAISDEKSISQQMLGPESSGAQSPRHPCLPEHHWGELSFLNPCSIISQLLSG